MSTHWAPSPGVVSYWVSVPCATLGVEIPGVKASRKSHSLRDHHPADRQSQHGGQSRVLTILTTEGDQHTRPWIVFAGFVVVIKINEGFILAHSSKGMQLSLQGRHGGRRLSHRMASLETEGTAGVAKSTSNDTLSTTWFQVLIIP